MRTLHILGHGLLDLAADDRRNMHEPEWIDTVIDFEFGDSGRAPNFKPSWWIVPGVFVAIGLLLGAIALWN